MKKFTSAILIFTLACSTLLAGCAMTEEKAIKRYKESFENMEKMQQYTMQTEATLGMEIMGLKIDFDIDMQSAIQDQGKKASHTIDLSLFGEKQTMQVYQDGNDVYSTVPDLPDLYVKNSIPAPAPDASSTDKLNLLGDIRQFSAYLEAIDKASQVTFEEKDDKSLLVAFDFTEESLKLLQEQTISILEEQAISMIQQDVHAQVQSLPLPEETKNQMEHAMLEGYKKIFSSLTIDSIHTQRIIGKDGYPVEEHITMQLTMDFSQLLDLLGEDLDDAAKEVSKKITLSMDVTSRFSNINQEVAVEFPEFTDDNVITSSDLLTDLDDFDDLDDTDDTKEP